MYDELDPTKIQETRMKNYKPEELRILDYLNQSQLHSKYGDGTYCAMHNHKWSNEFAKFRNTVVEKERINCGKHYRICQLCDRTIHEQDCDYHLSSWHNVETPSRCLDLCFIPYLGNRGQPI